MKALFILCGVVAACLLNYLVIDRLVIPDPCYYHGHDTPWLIDLFYTMESVDGFHPFPSLFNFAFTVLAGGLIGHFLHRRFCNRHLKNGADN